MPTPKLVQIDAWSYSRFGDYEKCPALAKYKHVLKIKEPGGPALDKGNLVHALAQMWVMGAVPKLDRDNASIHAELVAVHATGKIPPALARFEKEFDVLRKNKAVTEQQWAFDASWDTTDWFSKQAWCRIKVDAFWLEVKKVKKTRQETVVHIIDYKTGKEYPEHENQRSLYALGAFLMFPDAVRVIAEHWYTEQGVERPSEWPRSAAEGLKTYWTHNTEALLNDTTFAPSPGPHCQWCWFRHGNTKYPGGEGPCEY